jgi:hypothetical protein
VHKLTLWLGCFAVFASVLFAWLSPALAQDDGPPKIAVHIEGHKAGQFREAVLEALPEGIEVAEEKEFKRGLAQVGLPGGKMGYAVTSPGQRPKLIKVIRKVVKRQNLAGVVVGRVRAGARGLEMVTLFVDDNDDLAVDEKVSLKGDREAQVAAIEAALGEVFAKLAPEPEPEEEAEPEEEEEEEQQEEEEEEDEEDEPSDFEANRVGSELFSVGLGAEFGGRFFSYNEPCSGTDNPCAGQYQELRPYDVFGVPGLVIEGAIYPAATLDIAVLSDLGIVLQYAHFFGLSSQVDSGDPNVPGPTFGTAWNRFAAGLRYRLRIGDADDHPIVISPDFRFGFQNFTFEADDAAGDAISNEIGSVEYVYLRGGIDARLPIVDVFAVIPSFGFVGPLSSGDSYDRVSGASVLAIDAGLTLAFVIGMGIEARAGFEYTRYFASFSPEPTDPAVAGGATDEFLGLRVGAAYVF